MVRKIIKIDEEKCNGCGICANACHEGAIDIVDGKAKLMREHFCDGLGDCLPACPTGAITFEEREAPEYDEAAVIKAKQNKNLVKNSEIHTGCPGMMIRQMNRRAENSSESNNLENKTSNADIDNKLDNSNANIIGSQVNNFSMHSQLSNWPVQIKLVPIQAPYFHNANLLIAADCTAYAYANFHQEFIRNKVTLIGCPKLDSIDYSEKLTEIIRNNAIKSVTIVRMEVPCCGGLEMAAKRALQDSGKFIPWQVFTISIDGNIIE